MLFPATESRADLVALSRKGRLPHIAYPISIIELVGTDKQNTRAGRVARHGVSSVSALVGKTDQTKP